MSDNNHKIKNVRIARARRHRQRIKRVSDRPRLVVFRSAKHIYAQVIDDKESKTMASVSTLQKDFATLEEKPSGVDAAKWVGKHIAEKSLEAGVKQVVFDKGKYLYHGRIKALADAAREAGLDF